MELSLQVVFCCQGMVVLDDAVMDHRHFSCHMRMGILTCHAAVGRPAGVADSTMGNDGIFLAYFAQGSNFSDFFDKVDF